ncbi:MAG: M20 metallopeptidase family protein [Candidatus Hodarchaeales archaeon]|jgi:amidohydrolase
MNAQEIRNKIILDAKEFESYVINTRRRLHMFPETAYKEKRTAKFLEEELSEFGFNTHRISKTGVMTEISKGNDVLTVALRADIDALNISEENDVHYRSKNPGKMHACGHDAHTAMLLGAAKILSKYKDYLTNNVKFVFQPAEEGGGGAKKIVNQGFFEDVDYVFGIHVWQPLPSGTIATRKGAAFGSSDRFIITLEGKGGHAASPHQSIDPTSVLTDIYNSLQKMISREINPFESRVLSIPQIEGSKAQNIIPSQAILRGTLRTLNEGIRSYIINRIQEIVAGYCQAWGCLGKVDFNPINYPAVINDDDVVENISKIIKYIDEVKIMDQTMVGEDFAYYLQKAKGALLTLGIYNEAKGIIYPHHHPRFQIDESVLWKGTAVYSVLGFYSLFLELI